MDPTRATYPRLRWSLLGLASVAVVLLLVVTLLEYSRVQRVNRLASARTAALSAATRAGKPLLSYDYRTLDQQAQMTDPLLTPAYRKKYDATINNVVRTIAVPNKAVLTADVKVAGIRDVTESTASVLLYADLSSTNNQRPDTRVDHTPLVVCMVRTGGNWLVDDVETKLGYQCGASGGQPSSTGSSPATSPPATSPLATGSASPAAPTPSPSAGPRTPAAPSSAKPGAGTPTSP
jgi:Mce-associated membrane protein